MSNTLESKDIKDIYIADFESAIPLYGNSPDYLREVKKKAIARFSELGFPTTRNEEWKYTRIKPVVNHTYKMAGPGYQLRLKPEDIQPFKIAGEEVNLLVFENGIYNPALSSLRESIPGVVIGSIGQSLTHPAVSENLSHFADYNAESLVALNTALFQDGAFVLIPDNATFKNPIQILYINDSREEKYAVYPRTLVIVGKSSHVQLIESYHSLNTVNSFTNAVTEVIAGENSDVDLYKVQSEDTLAYQVNFTQVDQERNSNCSVHTLSLNGGFIRNNLNYLMKGSNCESHMYGLYILAGTQFVDNHTFVDHAVPNCYSNELYKGIMADRSTGVFNGKIMVRQDAQKTNAYQSNSNILLSDDATIYTKPQLEIFADDVKCSHGATTGQLDMEALFYLRARGIGEEQARSMLMFAFAGDVLNTIKIEALKESMLQLIAQRFNQDI